MKIITESTPDTGLLTLKEHLASVILARDKMQILTLPAASDQGLHSG